MVAVVGWKAFACGACVAVLTFAAPVACSSLSSRQLQMDMSNHSHTMFLPQECNSVVSSCEAWSAQSYDLSETVVIPCGTCITMDDTISGELPLPMGLDVQGTLVIARDQTTANNAIRIVTPFLRVQGHLNMTTGDTPVTGDPLIQITLTGTNETLTEFIPAGINKHACTKNMTHTAMDDSMMAMATPCTVGKKPFVIAGGTLDIHGLAPTCPVWHQLMDVTTESFSTNATANNDGPTYTPPPGDCKMNLVDQTFDSAGNVPEEWDVMPDRDMATTVTELRSLKVTNRRNSNKGPTIRLNSTMLDCLQPTTTYLLTAKVRLTMADGTKTFEPTTCSLTNKFCLNLKSFYKNSDNKKAIIRQPARWFKGKWTENYNEWATIHAKIQFTDEEINPINREYHDLRFIGVETFVDIELDDVKLFLPGADAFPQAGANTCQSLLPASVANLDSASTQLSTYPLHTLGGGHLKIGVDDKDGSKFIRHFARKSVRSSVTYHFQPECMNKNYVYKISMKIRAPDTSEPVGSRIHFESSAPTAGGKTKRFKTTLTQCPKASNGTWITCETEFVLLPKMVNNFVDFKFFMWTEDNYKGDVDMKDMSIDFVEGPVTGLIVPSDVGGCWGEGADVLITSHTNSFDDHQVRRLTGAPTPHPSSGGYLLLLNDTIVRPTTVQDSKHFAVEVALLSRNILFQGAYDDPNEDHGAHCIFFHTPHIAQTLQGVEFRNSGQQGTLGRYPIHFHMSDSVEGSVISKNTIRESNQRCIVVHGTHNVTISENIAFDTKGHCFMTEDGGEVDNLFLRNLGAYTRKVDKQISEDESDFKASTFWMTNPANVWKENVAAGSQVNGFWLELQSKVRGPTRDMPLSQGMNPKKSPLKGFISNVAHSNVEHGLRSYPFGYIPDKEAVFYNMTSYLNKKGAFFHASRNLALEGGLFSDNRGVQTDFDRADNIRFENATVIGMSSWNQELSERQPMWCGRRIGTELHTFTNRMKFSGATIRGVSYSGFGDSCGKGKSAAIGFDSEVRSTAFEYWSTLQNVSIAPGDTAINMCNTESRDVTDAYLIDLDSSLKPENFEAEGASAIITDHVDMPAFAFIDLENCKDVTDGCYVYCKNTCLRTVTYFVDPSHTEDYELMVTSNSDDTKSSVVKGSFYNMRIKMNKTEEDVLANTKYSRYRTFHLTLPAGSYKAQFFDATGTAVWPNKVYSEYEPVQCEGALEEGSVKLITPTTDEESCTDLIRNGDIDESNTDHIYWAHNKGGVMIAVGEGRSGNALSDTQANAGALTQYLDMRCLKLMEGRQYELQAYIKLQNADSTTYECDSDCPEAHIAVKSSDGKSIMLSVADEYDGPTDTDGWRILRGIFTFKRSDVTLGGSALFSIQRNANNVKMLIDDVSLSLLPLPNCESNLVRNGDFATGNYLYWSQIGTRQDIQVDMTGTALRMSDRRQSWNSMSQYIANGCLEEGERYVVSSRYQLENQVDASPFACDRSTWKGTSRCPYITLRTDSGEISQKTRAHTAWPVAKAGSWNAMYGIHTATALDAEADATRISWNAETSQNIIVDDVSIIHLPKNCDQLIMNGDGEHDNGQTAAFWSTIGPSAVLNVTDNNGNHAITLTRAGTRPQDGMGQTLDARCLTEGSSWNIEMKLKITHKVTGDLVSCDPTTKKSKENACPHVTIAGKDVQGNRDETRLYTETLTWVTGNIWNTWKTSIEVDQDLAAYEQVDVQIRRFDNAWTIEIDDFFVTPRLTPSVPQKLRRSRRRRRNRAKRARPGV